MFLVEKCVLGEIGLFNFFVDASVRQGDCYYITGDNYNHIKNVLRMGLGDKLLISENGVSNLCEITTVENGAVIVSIIEENYNNTELPVKIYLFQGLPKSDKMELIIQKTVELGVDTIVPVDMKNCVVKLDDKKKQSKTARWQAIAESAAKQSKRNSIPQVLDAVNFEKALDMCENLDLMLVPYENKDGMVPTRDALNELLSCSTVGIFIGPEGGFDKKEIEKAVAKGGKAISLGKRILRTETAAITAVGMCMLQIELNKNGED